MDHTRGQMTKTGKLDGKFIMQSNEFLEYSSALENMEAFVQTSLKYTAYQEFCGRVFLHATQTKT